MANYNSVTDNEIEQAKKYKDALDELQKSVVGLNSKLPSFADGLKAGLQGIGEKLPEVVQSMVNLNKQNKEMAEAGGKPVNILKQLASSMFSWNGLISVGVTLLATYGGALIDWVSDLIKGETHLTSLGKAMKDQATIRDALSRANLKGKEDAQQELVHLKLLYNATQNKTLGDVKRKEAVDALKAQYPQYFKVIKDDIILNGKAETQYRKLAAAITATAQAKAAEEMMVANSKRQIGNSFKAQPLVAQLSDYDKKIKKAQEKYDSIEGPAFVMGYPGYNRDPKNEALLAINDLKKQKSEIQKQYNNIKTDSKLLEGQNKLLTGRVMEVTKDNGLGMTNGKGVPDEPKGNGGAKPNNNYNITNKIAEESANIFAQYNKRVNETNTYYDKLKANKKLSVKEQQDLEKQHQEALTLLKADFQKNDLEKLSDFEHQLQQIVIDSTESAQQKAILQAEEDKNQKLQAFDKETEVIKQRIIDEQKQLAEIKGKGHAEDERLLDESIKKQNDMLAKAAGVRIKYEAQLTKQVETVKNENPNQPNNATTANTANEAQPANKEGDTAQPTDPTLKQQLVLLKAQHDAAIKNSKLTQEEVKKIEEEYAKKKADLEDKLVSSKIHAGDKYIDAVLKNTKKDSAIYKAAFMAKKATSIADVIISTKKGIIGSFEGYAHLPFIGQALAIAQAAIIAGQGAASIADIAKQKPGFATGGQYMSDGRGALLPGYSRTDNTNAFLRSGEAVVVSEAMRNPWARNLVSAINVAHGGRDFSIPNMGRGYAIGGIFTDGGNANRYYNQPVNDAKELANTLAYQMINNFPPIYVDVKDVNNQQNILAQTVNRVNL
ncbi:hypothetical protein EWM62_19065 [Mucilaginibacter terrigena]|uniref:Bacteriophage tail tape measure N-terminal domain-containing protein n=1 Tax=Mucilaginibacter terrigena TaxID=2492395 RepID=A0A4Q5LGI3_9SPHI|nr:hypothetical protein [Mucilaginibacter terrigena]RYU85627.1 hypothetical protein EWM62_19065 [Mucilaginibacter terrigena]